MENRNKKIIAIVFSIVMILSIGSVLINSNSGGNGNGNVNVNGGIHVTPAGAGNGGGTNSSLTAIESGEACAGLSSKYSIYDNGEVMKWTGGVDSCASGIEAYGSLYQQTSSGITLESNTSTITGDPTASLTWNPTITASGGNSTGVCSKWFDYLHGSYTVQSTNTEVITIYNDPTVSITSESSILCSGESNLFCSNPSGGAGNYTFQWYLNGNAITSGGTTGFYLTSFTVSSLTYENVSVVVTDKTGYSVTSNVIEIKVYPPISASVSSNINPIAVNNTAVFTFTGSGGSGNFTKYEFYVNGTEIESSSSNTFSYKFTSVGNFTIYGNVIDSVGDGARSNTINEVVYPTVAVSSSKNPIVSGGSATFTATTNGSNSTYTYQWYVNGKAVSGATADTYTTSFSVNSNTTENINVTATDETGYKVNSTNVYHELVYMPLSVTLISSTNPTDKNKNVTFTAIASGGSGKYTNYNFYFNGVSVQSGTSDTFTHLFKNSGNDSVYAIATDNISSTAKSNIINETVNPSLYITSSINPIGIGNFTTFYSHTNTSLITAYNWTINGHTYTSRNVTVNFNTGGNYTISLSATTNDNQIVTSTYTEYVYAYVTIKETGLASGTIWKFTFNGNSYSINNTSYKFIEPIGIYAIHVNNINSYESIYAPHINLGNSNLTLAVTFYKFYNISVKESGLPTGTFWGFSFAGTTYNINNDSYNVFDINGAYDFIATTVNGYSVSAPTSITVNGSAITVNVVYAKENVTIISSKNPAIIGERIELNFTTTLSGKLTENWTINSLNYHTSIIYISFSESKIYIIDLTVSNSTSNSKVTFTEGVYAVVNVSENGLPSGTQWGFNISTHAFSSSNNYINAYEFSGTYSFSANNINHYGNNIISTAYSNGNINVNSQNITLQIVFAHNKYNLKVISSVYNSFNIANSTFKSSAQFNNHTYSGMLGKYTYKGIGLANNKTGFFYNLTGAINIEADSVLYLNYTHFNDHIIISLTGVKSAIFIFANEHYNKFANYTLTTGNHISIAINNFNYFPVKLIISTSAGYQVSNPNYNLGAVQNYSIAETISHYNSNNGVNVISGNMEYIMLAIVVLGMLILPIVIKKGVSR